MPKLEISNLILPWATRIKISLTDEISPPFPHSPYPYIAYLDAEHFSSCFIEIIILLLINAEFHVIIFVRGMPFPLA